LYKKYFFQNNKLYKNSFYKFPGVENCWNNRYLSNETSGQGSYGKNKEFNSKIINSFIKQNNIKFVDEFGCGDSNQLNSFNIRNYDDKI